MKKEMQGFSGKVIYAASLFALAVGTFKVIGLLSGIWIFTDIAETFAMSPAPSPFSTVMTHNDADMDTGLAFGCEAKSGDIKWAKWDYKVRGAVPGPHRRGVTFLRYFGIARFAQRSEEDAEIFNKFTRYYFCTEGTLARAAQCEPNPEAIHVRIANLGRQQGALKVRIPCSP